LCLFFYKTSDKGRTGLPGSKRRRVERGGEGGQRGEMTQTMYADVNKCIIN
jgi:hypothetical protein